MPNSRNGLFYVMIAVMMLVVLYAAGVMPLIVQIFTIIFQAIGSVFMSLIGRG